MESQVSFTSSNEEFYFIFFPSRLIQMWNFRYLRSNWIRRILSDGFKIRCYTMIRFDQLLFGMFRLFTLLSFDIRSSDLLNSDQIYVSGNGKIQSITSICIRYDSAASDVRRTSGYTVLNDT